jgi:hypothetical protein
MTSQSLDEWEKRAALFMLEDGRALIGVGDDGVRKVLDIPRASPSGTTLGKAPDFLSVTRGNKVALSEVKHVETGEIDTGEAIKQLTNAMKRLTEKGLGGDVERVEIMMPRGAPLKDSDMSIAGGYLVRRSTGERVRLPGSRNLVMVIQL